MSATAAAATADLPRKICRGCKLMLLFMAHNFWFHERRARVFGDGDDGDAVDDVKDIEYADLDITSGNPKLDATSTPPLTGYFEIRGNDELGVGGKPLKSGWFSAGTWLTNRFCDSNNCKDHAPLNGARVLALKPTAGVFPRVLVIDTFAKLLAFSKKYAPMVETELTRNIKYRIETNRYSEDSEEKLETLLSRVVAGLNRRNNLGTRLQEAFAPADSGVPTIDEVLETLEPAEQPGFLISMFEMAALRAFTPQFEKARWSIDWDQVARDYGGVMITASKPYMFTDYPSARDPGAGEARDSTSWHCGWDTETLVVWDPVTVFQNTVYPVRLVDREDNRDNDL